MKKYKTTVVVIMLFSILYSCGLREKSIMNSSASHKPTDFELVKDYTFTNSYYFDVSRVRVKKNDSSFYIIPIPQTSTDSITVYDFEKRGIALNIPLPVTKRIYDVYFQNKDSIFLLFKPERNFHDSTLFLVDYKGKILQNFSLKDANVICSGNLDYDPETVRYIRFYSELCYESNALFFHTKKLKDGNTFLGDNKSDRKPFTGIGFLDTGSQTFEYLDELSYPNISENIYYPDGYGHPFITLLGNGSELLVSFRYTPLIYNYNYKERTIKKFEGFKSFFADSIKASKTIPESRYVNNRFSYLETVYDSKYNRFIRTLGFPQYLNKRSLLVADSAFNVLWEGLMPENAGFVTAMSDNNFLFYNAKKSKDASAFIFSEYVVTESTTRTESMLDYIKSQSFDANTKSVEEYIDKRIKLDDSATAVVIIPTSNCEAVSYRLLNFYAVNYEVLSQKPVYYIIAGAETTDSNKMLQEVFLDEKTPNIYFDSTDEYYKYCKPGQLNKPRLILFQADTIRQDISYDALNVYNFEPELLLFLKQYGIISNYYKE